MTHVTIARDLIGHVDGRLVTTATREILADGRKSRHTVSYLLGLIIAEEILANRRKSRHTVSCYWR
eukprot:988544-Rhodomonas_salina.3